MAFSILKQGFGGTNKRRSTDVCYINQTSTLKAVVVLKELKVLISS